MFILGGKVAKKEQGVWLTKLTRLCDGRNFSALERRAGLPKNTLTRTLAGQMPRAVLAVKIARELGVPTDWLFDEERDWPPPSRENGDQYGELFPSVIEAVYTIARQVGVEIPDELTTIAVKSGLDRAVRDERKARRKRLPAGSR